MTTSVQAPIQVHLNEKEDQQPPPNASTNTIQPPTTATATTTPQPSIGLCVTKAIEKRHSTRAFKPDPIPISILEECLATAQHSPSNSNIQPWRVHIASGTALQRLSTALLAAENDPLVKSKIEAIPESYRHYRSELGHLLYGKDGYNVPRSDKEAMVTARNRNYQFFGAPTAIILCVENNLADIDILSAGLYLQTLTLLLQERGLGNCIEVSAAGYPDVIRQQLGIGENMSVLCGVAVGYEDESQQVNRLKMSRDAWKDVVTFVSE